MENKCITLVPLIGKYGQCIPKDSICDIIKTEPFAENRLLVTVKLGDTELSTPFEGRLKIISTDIYPKCITKKELYNVRGDCIPRGVECIITRVWIDHCIQKISIYLQYENVLIITTLDDVRLI